MTVTMILRRIAVIAALLFSPLANAADLNSAKAQGWIGEQGDGLLGVVDASAPADVKAMVKSINEKRRQEYQEVARDSGAPLKAVMARAGAQLTSRTARGHYFKDASGRWRKR